MTATVTTKAMPKGEYPVQWIEVSNLRVVWPSAQRSARDGKVEAIKKNFDPDAFGVVAVTLPNGNGIYHVIDGQHRVRAVRELWGEGEKVPCMVLNGRTQAEAAHIWSLMNGDRTMPYPVDRFKVAVTAGRPEEVDVSKIIKSLGYRVSMDSDDGSISAIMAVMGVYRDYGAAHLTWALGTIQETWGKTRDSTNGAIVQAYAMLLAEHPTVERPRLVQKVAKQYTPARLLGAAKTHREMFKGRLATSIKELLVQSYNHNLRTSARLGDE